MHQDRQQSNGGCSVLLNKLDAITIPTSVTDTTYMSCFPAKASLKLNVVVVGGGIDGLAVAFRLTQAGHHVRVLEKSKSQEKACGIRVPPNLTKILDEWGLGEQVVRSGKPVNESRCYSMETGELLGQIVWQPDVFREMGAQLLVMHYQDLHGILRSAVESAGIQVSYGTTVTKVFADPPRVELASGEIVYADMIIGADGPQSIVREAVEGKPNNYLPREDDFSAYAGTIPREKLQTDPELNAFTSCALGGPQNPLWLGTSCHAVGFPMRDESEFAITVFLPDRSMDEESKKLDSTIPSEKLHIPPGTILRRILDLCPTLQRTPYIKGDFAAEWTESTGRIVLIGDAAHPSIPFVTQGASLDVEDAEVLGFLMSRLHSREELPYLLQAFQELRQDRCRTVHGRETSTFRLAWLAPGPRRDLRNAALMSSNPAVWDNAKLREQWEELSGVLAYNAREAAENWWVSWGILRERSQSASFVSGLTNTPEQETR